jgi:hypothetical protein
MALCVKITVFWDMVPCMSSLIDVQRLLEEHSASIFMVEENKEKSTMKVEGACSSKMSVSINQLTWCLIPEDSNLCMAAFLNSFQSLEIRNLK